MSGLALQMATVMNAVLREIQKLSDDELKRFLAGEGTLRYVPKGYTLTPAPSTRPAVTLPVTVAHVRERLRAATSEAEAKTYLRGLGLRLDQLRLLAQELEVRPANSTTTGILSDIVKVYVAGRVLTRAVHRS